MSTEEGSSGSAVRRKTSDQSAATSTSGSASASGSAARATKETAAQDKQEKVGS
jgi:hypothetical protein